MTHSPNTPALPSTGEDRQNLSGALRQMIAVLQAERQALATLKADSLLDVTQAKEGLCTQLAQFDAHSLDEETRALTHTAKSLNDVNRRVRNLLAANVTSRLETLGGAKHSYSANPTAG